jgi:hypothetical protein
LQLTIIRFLHTTVERLLWLIAREERHKGVRIGLLSIEGDRRNALFAKVRGALDLIRTRAPHRYARISRDIKGVLVGTTLDYARGASSPDLRTCLLSEVFVEAAAVSQGQVASTIIHEATHIRLGRCGIRVTPANRARIERICQRAQAAFAEALPDDRAVLNDAEKGLALDPTTWADENLRLLDEASVARQGLPRWVASIRAWFRRAT